MKESVFLSVCLVDDIDPGGLAQFWHCRHLLTYLLLVALCTGACVHCMYPCGGTCMRVHTHGGQRLVLGIYINLTSFSEAESLPGPGVHQFS